MKGPLRPMISQRSFTESGGLLMVRGGRSGTHSTAARTVKGSTATKILPITSRYTIRAVIAKNVFTMNGTLTVVSVPTKWNCSRMPATRERSE